MIDSLLSRLISNIFGVYTGILGGNTRDQLCGLEKFLQITFWPELICSNITIISSPLSQLHSYNTITVKVEISKFLPFMSYMVMKGSFNVTMKVQNYAFIIIVVINSCLSFCSIGQI